MNNNQTPQEKNPQEIIDNANKTVSFESDKKPDGLYFSKRSLRMGAIALAGILGLSVVAVLIFDKRKSDTDRKHNDSDKNQIVSTVDQTKQSSATATESEVMISKPTETVIQTEATSTITITPETDALPPNVVDYDILPTDMAEGYSFEIVLTQEQQDRISNYNDMSLEDFRSLPDSEQLTFAYWVFENNKPKFDHTIRVHGYDLRYTANPETAKEISENYYYLNNFINNFLVKDKDDMTPVRDVNTAKKCAILIHSFSPSPFEALDETLDYVYNTYKRYIYTRPNLSDETMREENGQIIVITHQTTSDFNAVDPEHAYVENTYMVTEFESIEGNTINYHLRISSRYISQKE